MTYKYIWAKNRFGNMAIKRASFTESEMIESIIKRCKTTDKGCLEWPGHRSPRGYGVVGFKKKVYRVHRLLWILIRGPIKDKLEVCHSCDNPACCEMDHLFLGTHLENMRDAVSKNRLKHIFGEAHPSAKLTEADVKRIRKECANGAFQAAVGRKYGITQRNVWCIVHRKTWAHVH